MTMKKLEVSVAVQRPSSDLLRNSLSLSTPNNHSFTPTPKGPVDMPKALQMVHVFHRSRSIREQTSTLKKMRSLAKQSSKNCRCLEAAGVSHALASLAAEEMPPLHHAEELVSTLALFHLDDSSRALLMSNRALKSLCNVLSGNNLSAKISAANLLEILASDVDIKVKLGNIQLQAIEGLMELVKEEENVTAIKSGLKTLIQISQVRKNRPRLISKGGVTRIIGLLSSSEKGISELALTLLYLLCRTPEGKAKFGKEEMGMAAVARKLIRVSHSATENAVAILWEMYHDSSDELMRTRAADARVFEKLLLLLQLDISPLTRSRVADLLRILAKPQS